MKKGFTLIELMVVVVIIGILAALAIPKFMGATDKAKLAEWKNITKQITTLQNTYFIYFDKYASENTPVALSLSNVQNGLQGSCPAEGDGTVLTALGFLKPGDGTRFNYWTTGAYDGLGSANNAVKIGGIPFDKSGAMNGDGEASGELTNY